MPTENEARLIGALRRCIAVLERSHDPAADVAIEAGRDEIQRLIPHCQHDLLLADTTIEISEHGTSGWLAKCLSCGHEFSHKFPVVYPPR